MPGLRRPYADRADSHPTVQGSPPAAAQPPPAARDNGLRFFREVRNKMRGRYPRWQMTTPATCPAVAPLRRTPCQFIPAPPPRERLRHRRSGGSRLMAAEERNVRNACSSRPAAGRGNPHVHLVGGAAQRSAGRWRGICEHHPSEILRSSIFHIWKTAPVFRSLSVSQG